MAKISEAAKAECNRMQNKYKELLQAVEVNIDKMEKELNSIEDEFEIAKNKIDLAVLHIKASSFIATICNISLSLNEEVHEFLKDKFSDEWRYKFICSFGYIIDYFKFCYGENSKWLQNFVEIEGRFALITKNIIDFKNYIRELSPEMDGYMYRVKLMNLAKSLIWISAEQYRAKYELQDRLPDDMKMALNMSGALRRIYIYLNETEEAEEQKKIYDLWKKKLDADLKDMKK